MDNQFKGKVALVTRAGQGIGRAICIALAKDGATVHALGRHKSDLDTLRNQCPGIRTYEVDLSNWDATRKLVLGIGRVDLLVNNTGYLILKPFLETKKADFDRIFAFNVGAVFNVSQAVAANMVKGKRGGAIVNVSSCAGTRAFPRETAYCGSKAAVDMMTRAMAIELGKHKIRVNSVDSTLSSSSLMGSRQNSMDSVAMSRNLPVPPPRLKRSRYIIPTPPPRRRRSLSGKGIPRGAFQDERDVVYAVLFLLSDDADIITGTSLPGNGSTLQGGGPLLPPTGSLLPAGPAGLPFPISGAARSAVTLPR